MELIAVLLFFILLGNVGLCIYVVRTVHDTAETIVWYLRGDEEGGRRRIETIKEQHPSVIEFRPRNEDS